MGPSLPACILCESKADLPCIPESLELHESLVSKADLATIQCYLKGLVCAIICRSLKSYFSRICPTLGEWVLQNYPVSQAEAVTRVSSLLSCYSFLLLMPRSYEVLVFQLTVYRVWQLGAWSPLEEAFTGGSAIILDMIIHIKDHFQKLLLGRFLYLLEYVFDLLNSTLGQTVTSGIIG